MAATTTTSETLHARTRSGVRPANPRAALWARLGSFLSMLPLGIWTVNHLWDNLAVFQGAEAWQRSVTAYPHPLGHALILAMVLLPLLIHTIWGVQRLVSFHPNTVAYPFFGNWKYIIQRVSAAGVLLFIGAHMWLALLRPRLVEGHAEPFSNIASWMRFHPPTLMVYIFGTLGVCYHLANGIFGFAWTWGLTSGERSYKRVGVISVVAFIILLAMAWGAIYGLWSAGEAFGPPAT